MPIDCVFFCCGSLTSITIPNSVFSIGDMAFVGCDELQYNVYGNAKYLGNADNPYHALITVENSNLSSYEIHNKTKVICDMAFSGCGRLTSITIPDSVIFIGDYAFYKCNSLTNITYGGTIAQWKNIKKGTNCFLYTKDLKIHCTDGEI